MLCFVLHLVVVPEMAIAVGEYVLVNMDTVGYYRVNYDLNNWNNLLLALAHNHLVSSYTKLYMIHYHINILYNI